MEAKELRIGNWVLYQGQFKIVRYIQIDRIGSIKKNLQPQTILLSKCHGIPLTEEILLKCGFEIKPFSMGLTFDRFRFIWKENYKYWYVIDKHNQAYYSKIEFVHELQNLIFIMNGKELEINL